MSSVLVARHLAAPLVRYGLHREAACARALAFLPALSPFSVMPSEAGPVVALGAHCPPAKADTTGSAQSCELVTYRLVPLRPDILVTLGLCTDVRNMPEVFEKAIRRTGSPTKINSSRSAGTELECKAQGDEVSPNHTPTFSPVPELQASTASEIYESEAASIHLPDRRLSTWLCMNPASLVGVDQVLLGVLRAVEHFENGKMKTNDLRKEILYCASPSRNIAQALNHIGLRPEMSHLLLVMVQMNRNEQSETCANIQGRWTSLTELAQLTDTQHIKSVVGITEEEAGLPGGFAAAVISRLASKYI